MAVLDPNQPPETARKLTGTAGGELIQKALLQIRRRVFVNCVGDFLCFDLLVALSLFGGFLLLHRLFHLPVDPLLFLYGTVAASVMVTLIRSLATARSSLFRTAILVDVQLCLQERLSTAIYLRDETTEAGDRAGAWRELIERDGVKAIAATDVRTHFPIRLPRLARWTLLPLLFCLAVTFFVPQLDLLGFHNTRLAQAAYEEEIQKNEEEAVKQLEELSKQSEEDPELEEILEAMKKEVTEKAEKKPGPERKPGGDQAEAQKKQSLVKFNRMENVLRRNLQKDKFKDFRQFLDKNRSLSVDPNSLSRRLQEALKKGDLKEAASELEKLKEELQKLKEKQKSGKLNKEELERLTKLASELERLSRNSASLAQLSGSLKALMGGLSSGDLSGALGAMEQLDLDLEDLAQLMRQMEFLNQSLELVKLTKQDLANLHKCPNCGKPRLGRGGT